MIIRAGQRYCSVYFKPMGVEVNVLQGTTIMDAVREAGIYIGGFCGGEGICGKCKVVVTQGQVGESDSTLFENEKITKDYVLACHAIVQSNLEVEIPAELSSLDKGPEEH